MYRISDDHEKTMNMSLWAGLFWMDNLYFEQERFREAYLDKKIMECFNGKLEGKLFYFTLYQRLKRPPCKKSVVYKRYKILFKYNT